MTQYAPETRERIDTGTHGSMEHGEPGTAPVQEPPRRDFEDSLTRDMRVALHDFIQVETRCNWCADECLGHPGMEECARICRDVADLAALNAEFLSRDSLFGADVAEAFAYAAEECERVCSQYSDPHCQECASALRRAIDSTWAMLDSLEHVPQGGQQRRIEQF